MKHYIFLLIFGLIFHFSCQEKSPNPQVHPKRIVKEVEYQPDDFILLEEGAFKDEPLPNEWHSFSKEIGVQIADGKLRLGTPVDVLPFFELDDGKLEIINKGEFGGALNYIPNDGESDTLTICEMAIRHVFEWNGHLYFTVGIPHLGDSGGMIFELERKGDKFSYEEVLRLGSVPMAIATYEDKIFIAGYSYVTIVHYHPTVKDLKVIRSFEKDDIYCCSYGNSVAVKNEHEIYVGMKNAYAKISWVSGEITVYEHIESLSQAQRLRLESEKLSVDPHLVKINTVAKWKRAQTAKYLEV
ncbi:MAG: hypothetical protein AAFU33_13735 [Bacteroidota bacterium]